MGNTITRGLISWGSISKKRPYKSTLEQALVYGVTQIQFIFDLNWLVRERLGGDF